MFFGTAVPAQKKFGIFAVNYQSFEFKYVSYESGIDSAFNKGGKRCIYKVKHHGFVLIFNGEIFCQFKKIVCGVGFLQVACQLPEKLLISALTTVYASLPYIR